MTLTLFPTPTPPLHIICHRDQLVGVWLVLLLGEIYGHGPWLTATIEYRGGFCDR